MSSFSQGLNRVVAFGMGSVLIAAATACGGGGSGGGGDAPKPENKGNPVVPVEQDPSGSKAGVRVDRGETQTPDLRQVSYSCQYALDHMYTEPGDENVHIAKGGATCDVGYVSPEADAVGQSQLFKGRTIESPVGVETKFLLSGLGGVLDYDASSKTFVLASEIGPSHLPFGKGEDCSLLEIGVRYRVNGAPGEFDFKEARLAWEKQYDTVKKKHYWQALSQANLPAPALIQSAQVATGSIFLHCTWQNETGLDVTSIGAVASVTP